MARKIELKKGDLNIRNNISRVFEKTITKFGTVQKLMLQKNFWGKRFM